MASVVSAAWAVGRLIVPFGQLGDDAAIWSVTVATTALAWMGWVSSRTRASGAGPGLRPNLCSRAALGSGYRRLEP